MTPMLSHFTQVTPYQGTNLIMIGNCTKLSISHVGTFDLLATMGNISILSVPLVPGLCRSLLSIRYLAKDLNLVLSFDDRGFHVKVKGGFGANLANLYLLGINFDSPTPSTLVASRVSSVVWHVKLGHPTQPVLKVVLSYVTPSNVYHSLLFVCATNKVKKFHSLDVRTQLDNRSRSSMLIYGDLRWWSLEKVFIFMPLWSDISLGSLGLYH